jgi:hypothetical protein
VTVALQQPSRRVRDALEPWCAVGATGALRVLDPPGGTVYLTAGLISYAESPPACGVDRMLTASGLVSPDGWRAALAAGRGARRVGEALIEHGLVSPSELETAVLSSIYGAAHFLLPADLISLDDARFEMGAGHVLGRVVGVDLYVMCEEVDRRRRMLADAWPDSRVDSHAVVPARRLAGHHVALTALQWEIVANADRRRTPVDLARSLGRDTFATLLEVRRMARAGLVEPGRPGAAPPAGARGARGRELAEPSSVEPSSAETSEDPSPAEPVRPPRAPAAAGNGGAVREPAPPVRRSPDPAGAPLPRRDGMPAPWRTAPSELPPAPPCPDSTLERIRDALEAMR